MTRGDDEQKALTRELIELMKQVQQRLDQIQADYEAVKAVVSEGHIRVPDAFVDAIVRRVEARIRDAVLKG
jgi:hypothetical protein